MKAERGPGDRFDSAGFSLVENVLAMVLFMVIVAAALPLLVRAFQAQGGLSGKETAIAVANGQLEYIRSVTPSKLVAGRSSSDVAALTSTPGLVDLADDLTSSGNFDPSAPAGSSGAAVPLTATQTVSGVTYTARNYINACYLTRDGSACTASPANGSLAYRVSVDVSWPVQPGVNCASGRPGQCEYVVTSLIDPSVDPTFYLYGSPTIAGVYDANWTPVTAAGIHPGQVLSLQVVGTNFAAGATAVATSGDRTSQVSSNTGNVIAVQYGASPAPGPRTFSVVNPNGTTGSTTINVTKSAPTITDLSPTTVSRNVSTTFTLTGSDLFATPSLGTQTVAPTVTLDGTASIAGVPFSFTVKASNVTVASSTSLTFRAALPAAASVYTATGTLSVTNPDGGGATYRFTVTTI